jgi:uncharacterized protein (UPF0276 family)
VFPTLLERDFNFPPLPELLSEIETIHCYQRKWTVEQAIVSAAARG